MHYKKSESKKEYNPKTIQRCMSSSNDIDNEALHTDTVQNDDTQPATESNEQDEFEHDTQRALKALRELTADEDNPVSDDGQHSKLTLSSILGGDMLGGRWFRKQFWFIIMVVAMIIVYVSNRYSCQQEMIQTKLLTDTLLDRRYKALTRSSQLKEKTRRSYIEDALVDTTLQTSNTPSFNLKVDEWMRLLSGHGGK